MRDVILTKLKDNIGALCSFLRAKYNKEYLDYLNNNIPLDSIEFKTSEKLYLFEHEYKSVPICSCGKKLKYVDYTQGYRKTCGDKKCYVNLRKKTNTLLYGVDNPMKRPEIVEKALIKLIPQRPDMVKKAKQTNLSKYGVDNPMKTKEMQEKVSKSYKSNPNNKIMEKERAEKSRNKSIEEKDEINHKRLETIISEWGTWEVYSKHIQGEIKQTSLTKYGVDHFFKSDIVSTKRCESYIKKSIDNTIRYLPLDINYISRESNKNKTDHYFNLLCTKCNSPLKLTRQYIHKNKNNLCYICNPKEYGTSNAEKEILEYVSKLYKGEIIINTKSIISPFELDIYIPELNIAIEYNGVFWHSDKYKDENYHLNKLNRCNELGIKLFTIWEDDWILDLKYTKTKIKSIFKDLVLNTTKDINNIYLSNVNRKTFDKIIKLNRNITLNIDKMFKVSDPSLFGFKLVGETDPILESKILNKEYKVWNCGYEKWIYVV